MLTCFGLIFVLWCEPPKKTVVRDYCRLAKTLQVSRQDTAETRRQALRHNRTYKRVCRRR